MYRNTSRALFFCILLLGSNSAFAKKYALVVAGASYESDLHDSARTTASVAYGLSKRGDYQVTYLLGDGPNGHDTSAYPDEMAYIHKILPQTKSATVANLDKELNRIVTSTKKGDQVELYITAHGQCADGTSGEQCRHEFKIYRQGTTASYSSDQLLKYIEQLDKKGVKTTLVFESCYSGALDEKVRSLHNTCAFLLSSKYSAGQGCYTNEPIEKKYYTTTVEYIALRYYENVVPQLQNGFYAKNSCFTSVQKAKKQMGDQFSTISDAYWSALKYDVNPHRPIISTMSERNFDLSSRLEHLTVTSKPCEDCAAPGKNPILSLQDDVTAGLRKTYAQELEKYNESVRVQKTEINHPEKLSLAQAATEQIAPKLLQLERQIMTLEEPAPEENDACRRPL